MNVFLNSFLPLSPSLPLKSALMKMPEIPVKREPVAVTIPMPLLLLPEHALPPTNPPQLLSVMPAHQREHSPAMPQLPWKVPLRWPSELPSSPPPSTWPEHNETYCLKIPEVFL